jgi:hypothetical protein
MSIFDDAAAAGNKGIQDLAAVTSERDSLRGEVTQLQGRVTQLEQELADCQESPAAAAALGVNVTHLADWKAKGGPTEWTRCFAQNQAWSPTATVWKAMIDAAKRGEKVASSSKPPGTMSAIASGTYDAHFRNIATGLAGLATDGVYTFYHEPEDNIQRGEFTFAQFIAASKRVYSVMRPILQPSGWRTAVCLMGWTVDSRSGRNIDNYFDAGLLALIDVIAWDPYNYGGGTGTNPAQPWATQDPRNTSPSSVFTNCVTTTQARGKTPMVFETGCNRREADTTGAERTGWWEMVAELPIMREFEAIMHFEMSSADGVSNTAIRDEPASLAAFKAIGQQ